MGKINKKGIWYITPKGKRIFLTKGPLTNYFLNRYLHAKAI